MFLEKDLSLQAKHLVTISKSTTVEACPSKPSLSKPFCTFAAIITEIRANQIEIKLSEIDNPRHHYQIA